MEPSTIGDSSWRKILRKHWGAVAVLIIAGVSALAGSVYVFWWFTGDAQTSGLVPSSLGLWTMANLIAFILYSIFWELLIIGVPVAIGVVIGWQWWRRLPDEERRDHHFARRSRRASGGSGGSFLFFIAFCIKIYQDGNWNAPIATWTLNYVIGSVVLILVWFAVIFGIPATIAGIWWVRREMRKP